jgi:hypothetical protein
MHPLANPKQKGSEAGGPPMVHFEGLMRVMVRSHRGLVFSVWKNPRTILTGWYEVDGVAVGG